MRWTNLIIGFCWMAFAVYWLTSAFNVKKGTMRMFGPQSILYRIVGLVIVYLIIAKFGWPIFVAHSVALEALGALLTIVGISFAIWARVHIGRNWGMPMSEKFETELVTSGPYSRVRHPIYSGILLAILGSALATSTAWLILFVFAGLYFVYSATVEERRMMEKLPVEYGEYRKRTKMLIPFIF